MKTAYRILAYLIALGVVLQAASIASGFFGIGRWVVAGNTLDRHTFLHDTAQLGGYTGLAFHYVVGQAVVPLLGLVLLILSFVTPVRHAAVWAGILLFSIIVQILLGLAAFHQAAAGAAHGFLAIVIFAVAAIAGYRTTHAADRHAADPEPVDSRPDDDAKVASTR